MTNKIHHGIDAELSALRHGVFHSLKARVADQLPMNKGNVLSRSAVGQGFFVALSKKSDGSLSWLAIEGPTATAIGIQFGIESWPTHKGPKSNRKVESVHYPNPVQN